MMLTFSLPCTVFNLITRLFNLVHIHLYDILNYSLIHNNTNSDPFLYHAPKHHNVCLSFATTFFVLVSNPLLFLVGIKCSSFSFLRKDQSFLINYTKLASFLGRIVCFLVYLRTMIKAFGMIYAFCEIS